MGRYTHIFSTFLDFIIREFEQCFREFLSILNQGIHVR
jgi:hypothetical protein